MKNIIHGILCSRKTKCLCPLKEPYLQGDLIQKLVRPWGLKFGRRWSESERRRGTCYKEVLCDKTGICMCVSFRWQVKRLFGGFQLWDKCPHFFQRWMNCVLSVLQDEAAHRLPPALCFPNVFVSSQYPADSPPRLRVFWGHWNPDVSFPLIVQSDYTDYLLILQLWKEFFSCWLECELAFSIVQKCAVRGLPTVVRSFPSQS